jgi:peptidoglycan/xylan/chitin deacetylase (PgdA/CDA1 family)
MRRASSRVAAALLALTFAGGAAAAACTGTVYLTFDTGYMSQAEFIARTLKEQGVKATFFLSNEPTFRGDHALDPSWAGYWRALAADGHVFGNHTWSHYAVRRETTDGKLLAFSGAGQELQLDQKQFCAELGRVELSFQRDTGQRLAGIWRAPGGRTTQNSVRWAASCGYPVHVHWDDAGFIGDELPSDRYSNKTLLDRALKNMKSGDIVLWHLGIRSRREPAAKILPDLIQGLKQKGFCFGTLDVVKR